MLAHGIADVLHVYDIVAVNTLRVLCALICSAVFSGTPAHHVPKRGAAKVMELFIR
jgi:hypothetical protein